MNQVVHVIRISLLINLFLSVIKIIFGFIGKSSALIADGIHSLSDLLTDVVAMIGSVLSRKPADEKHPYGHGKIEYITSMIIGLLIFILGCSIILKGSNKEIPSMFVLIVSFVAIISKFILSRYIIKKGKQYQNNILLASGYESKTDVISSIVVFFSTLMMQLSNLVPIFKYADMIATGLIAVLIIKIGFGVLKENISTMLEEQETNSEYIKEIRDIILKEKEIHNIDQLMILKYGSYYKLIAEVSVDSNLSIMKAHQYVHKAENRIRSFDSKVRYITIHINPDCSYQLINAQKQDLKKIESYYRKIILQNQTLDELDQETKLYIKENLNMHLEHFYMIMIDNKKIGTVAYYPIDEKNTLIDIIFIEEHYRHCSIASSIIKNIIHQYPSNDIVLWVYKTNSLALSMYEHLGFKKIKETNERFLMKFIKK